MDTVQNNTESETFDINIGDIIKFVKDNFKKIVVYSAIFAILGIVYALMARKEFESKTTLMPEITSKSSMGGLSSLASLAGVDIGGMSGGGDAVRPDLYPNILQSIPFALYLLKQKVYVSEYKDTMSVEQYFNKLDESFLTSLLKTSNKEVIKFDPLNKSKALELDKKQDALVKELLTRVVTMIDRKSGIITISTKMPDPVVAASAAVIAGDYLKEYVTSYRTDKAKRQVKFLGQKVIEAKQKYQAAELAVAGFKDRNRFLILSTPKVEEARLTADFMFAQNVHNELQRQYEQAKIKVEDETPVFKVLEPAKIPLKRSEPKRIFIVFIAALIGGLIGTTVALWPKIKEKLTLAE